MRLKMGLRTKKGSKAARVSLYTSHTVRTRDGGERALKCGRMLAIRLMCTECLGWGDDPKDCTASLCPLFPFRGRTRASQRGKIKSSP